MFSLKNNGDPTIRKIHKLDMGCVWGLVQQKKNAVIVVWATPQINTCTKDGTQSNHNQCMLYI